MIFSVVEKQWAFGPEARDFNKSATDFLEEDDHLTVLYLGEALTDVRLDNDN